MNNEAERLALPFATTRRGDIVLQGLDVFCVVDPTVMETEDVALGFAKLSV